jgi:NADP-dependent 3-hydroxy acid dehydrogenase YdfG
MDSSQQKVVQYLSDARTTQGALTRVLSYLVQAAEDSSRRVADVVSISSTAGRAARAGAGVCAFRKFGISAFSEALRRELIPQQNRVVEPGRVNTELVSQTREEIRQAAQRQARSTEPPRPEHIADVVVYIVTRNRRVGVNEALIRAAKQSR